MAWLRDRQVLDLEIAIAIDDIDFLRSPRTSRNLKPSLQRELHLMRVTQAKDPFPAGPGALIGSLGPRGEHSSSTFSS